MANVRDISNRPRRGGRHAQNGHGYEGQATMPYARSDGVSASQPRRRVAPRSTPRLGGPSTGPRLHVATRSRGFASVLHNPDFLRLWMAQLISQTLLNAANYGLIILVTTQVHS